MLQEIYQRGPISCGIATTKEFHEYTGGIFEDKTNRTEITHEISIVGFGEENGVKFWNLRNSWGINWGEQGFARVVRGTNNIAIETDCTWATPLDTWTNNTKHNTTDKERLDPANNSTNGPYPIPHSLTDLTGNPQSCRYSGATFAKVPERRPDVMSWEEVDVTALPVNWDWRNVNGSNWLSWNKN